MTLDDPQKASRLAQKVLALDSSIMSVGVISDQGVPQAGVIRKDLKQKVPEDRRAWEVRASRAAIIIGSLRTDDKDDSPIESVELIRERFKTLLIRIPDKGSDLGYRL